MDNRVFDCVSQVDGTKYRCYFVFIQTAISLRHSDTVDVRFLVNGKRITVALPHTAFVEYARRTGEVLTDESAIELASRHLKAALESGAGVEDMTVSSDRVLQLALGAPETAPDLNPPDQPMVDPEPRQISKLS